MNLNQLRDEIIIPVLKHLDMYSESAVNLMLGTCMAESNANEIKQLGGGPACSIWQIEPETAHDNFENYLKSRRILLSKVYEYYNGGDLEFNLVSNMAFACAMARIRYYRVKEALPEKNDIEGLANYWKKYYNTHLGAGDPQEFVKRFPKDAAL